MVDFRGVWYCKPFNVNNYNPEAIQNKVNKPTQSNNYFEILNEFSMAEHQIKFDNLQRDLIPFASRSFTTNPQYILNFDTGKPLGTECGGDFYLTKYPNMPFREEGGIRRVIDNMIRLSSENLKKGEPTRIEGIGSTYANAGHTGKYEWGVHYDYVDLDISGEKVYYSPTDISNLLTKQLHQTQDLYKSYDTTNGGGGRYDGGFWPNTAGKYPMNSLFRVIHGPSDTSNVWDSATGLLAGTYHEGDFCFFADIHKEGIINGINAFGCENARLQGIDINNEYNDKDKDYFCPASGKVPVWLPNNQFFMNTLPTTNYYTLTGYAYGDPVPNHTIRNFKTDADMRQDTSAYKINQTFGSMFVGANNAQLNYNTDISRFEWKFFHQPYYSDYNLDKSSGQSSGGNIVAKIWSEAIEGVDNWDRYGGINVVNWACPMMERNTATTRRDVKTPPLTYKDAIGQAFLNKLGFSNSWISANEGSTDYDDCSGYTYTKAYKPLGTTASDFDVSQAKPYTETSLMYQLGYNDPPRTAYNTPTTDAEKLAYAQADNAGRSLGAPQAPTDLSATSVPDDYYGGAQPWGSQNGAGTSKSDWLLSNVGATLGYGLVSTQNTPPSVIYVAHDNKGASIKVPTSLNLDDVKWYSYQVEVDSSALTADELPKKTLIGYFLIMSDIIDKHEFLGSANDGSPLKCIGILSKNYENNDFYFSFQSPVEFYVKQDRTITSIKTEILTPQLTDPAGLDYNSSIIYTIVRQQSLPEPDVPPIAVQQAYDYAIMEQMTGMMGIDMGQINPYSNAGQLGLGQGNAGGANLNALRQNLVSAVLHPTQNSASMIMSVQSEIGRNIGRMNLAGRSAMLREGLAEDPNDPRLAIAPPAPEQIQLEGLGIGQPAVGKEYLSEEQLLIEALNLMKGKASPESGVGGSIFTGMSGATGSAFGMRGGAEAFDPMARFVGGTGAQVPMNPTVEDDDIKSLMSAFTADTRRFQEIDELDEERHSVLSGSPLRSPATPRELFAEASRNTRMGGRGLNAMSIPEFFNRYMSVANEETRQQYRVERDNHGFDLDNPNVWRLGVLKSWAGANLDFNWGNRMYKEIGGTLNLEGRQKILQAINRYSSLDPSEQRAQRAIELGPLRERGQRAFDIPEPKYGTEELITRISRTTPEDTRTRQDEKSIGMDWSKSNPYDLRTWTNQRLRDYKTDLQFGVPVEARNANTKLSKRAMSFIDNELTGRTSKATNKILYRDDKTYSPKKAHRHYDPTRPWDTPHPNTGASLRFIISKKGGKKKITIRGDTPVKGATAMFEDNTTPLPHEGVPWKQGYISKYPSGKAKAHTFTTHEEVIRHARDWNKSNPKKKGKGITWNGKQYSLRLDPSKEGILQSGKRGGDKVKSYMFSDIHSGYPTHAPLAQPPKRKSAMRKSPATPASGYSTPVQTPVQTPKGETPQRQGSKGYTAGIVRRFSQPAQSSPLTSGVSAGGLKTPTAPTQ